MCEQTRIQDSGRVKVNGFFFVNLYRLDKIDNYLPFDMLLTTYDDLRLAQMMPTIPAMMN